MGSKVSSKMAAPAARAIQAVLPHAPLIKFPNRQGIPRPNGELKRVNNGRKVELMTSMEEPTLKMPVADETVQEALKTLAVNVLQHGTPSSPSAAAPPPLSRPQVALRPVPGTPDTLASVQSLPARYRRRQLTADEMEYIQRGGPE